MGISINGILLSNEKEQINDICYKMNIKNIVPSERNQSQKTTYYIIPVLRNSRIGKSMGTKSRLLVA